MGAAAQDVADPKANLRFFRIATGSAAGTYFPVGIAIALAISNPPGSRPCLRGGSCGVPGLVAVANTSDGSVANVDAVAGGVVDSGLAQADVISWAYNGEGMYSRKPKLDGLRVLANLYPEDVHLVVRRGAGMAQVRDLAGKRVSIDKPGSGTRINAELILSTYGVRLNQLKAVEVDPGEAVDLFIKGELDAFFIVAGYPAAAVADLARLGLIDLVPISGRPADAAVRRHRFFSYNSIPAGTYEGINVPVATLSIGAQWVVPAAADAELVYQIVKALWHPRSRMFLDTGHAKARMIQLETALAGVSTPLHPGAERFYREIGMQP
jgi:TRAP transporter TAXI family solute receptor